MKHTMPIELSQQSAKQWLTDGKAYNHPKHGLVTAELLKSIVSRELNKDLPDQISDYIARAYLNGTPIGMAKKVAEYEIKEAFMRWMYSLVHLVAADKGMNTVELRSQGVRALLEHEHLRIYEVRMMLRMIGSGMLRPKMDTRFLAVDLVECIQIYLEKRSKAVTEYNNKPREHITALPPAAKGENERVMQQLIEDLDLKPTVQDLQKKWALGATLTEHERQQIREEANCKAKGQAHEKESNRAQEENARAAKKEGR